MPSEQVRRRAELGVGLAIVFLAYTTTAKIGLLFDALGGVATTVWPPSGIALAALVLGGIRFWPVITLAAFVANLHTGLPVWGVALIAVGNTLEAVLGATLLTRYAFDTRVARVRDVLLLVGVALTSTIVSASFGLLTAALTHVHPAETLPAFWAVWWVGDCMGDLLVAPLICAWATPRRLSRRPFRWIEAALLAAALGFVSIVIFSRMLPNRAFQLVRGTYAIAPLLIWAALRFEQRGTTAALMLVATIAVTAASSPASLFTAATTHERLLMIQSYMAVTAVSMLILAAALAERRAAIGVRDEFISIASHELKTPLTALKLRLESATRFGARSTAVEGETAEARLAKALAAANVTTDRLVSLVDNLLDVSRLHAARLVLHLEPVALDEVVREVVGRLREQAVESGSPMELDLAEHVVGIWDRSRIEQVVTNLFTNAIRYGRGRPIAVSLRASATRVRLRVRDAGIGISRGDQSRIFRAFERIATRDHVGGLGLGLYIGQQIATAHGGTLAVESELGRGATFILDLPLAIPGAG
jgi:signal transduction histidine kinase